MAPIAATKEACAVEQACAGAFRASALALPRSGGSGAGRKIAVLLLCGARQHHAFAQGATFLVALVLIRDCAVQQA